MREGRLTLTLQRLFGLNVAPPRESMLALSAFLQWPSPLRSYSTIHSSNLAFIAASFSASRSSAITSSSVAAFLSVRAQAEDSDVGCFCVFVF